MKKNPAVGEKSWIGRKDKKSARTRATREI
jgi:hypothetical protein